MYFDIYEVLNGTENVENLQKNAELLLKEKEDSLKQELEETEAKLNELKENNSNEENISLEQTQTIKDFNNKILKIRKDLREVQRELGENIKKLEKKTEIKEISFMEYVKKSPAFESPLQILNLRSRTFSF